MNTIDMDTVTAEQLTEARGWIADSFGGTLDAVRNGDYEQLSTEDVVSGVQRHYEGGWDAFVAECVPAPLVHLASATGVIVNDEIHILAMCGTDIGTETAGHPWSGYTQVGSEYWNKVTCDPCKTRVLESRTANRI